MAAIMEQAVGNGSFSVSKQIYDYLPVTVLAVEAFCATLCNGALLILFCTKRSSLLRTASDFFTINLSLMDLIFSGIVLPIVILAALTPRKKCSEESSIEATRNGVLVFATMATALGTLLVSLDRGDVSLKPSKRFFTQSKAIIAIGSTWCISTIGLAITIFPKMLMPSNENRDFTEERRSSLISTISKNKTKIKHPEPFLLNAHGCHSSNPCNLSSMRECTFQIAFQTPIFVLAVCTIMIIYGKILWSVQRRSKKYMHGASKHALPTNYCDQNGRASQCNFCCCSTKNRRPQIPEKNTYRQCTVTNDNCHKMSSDSPKIIKRDSFRRRSLTVIKNFTSPGHKEAKKQDSLEDELFVNGKTEECQDSSSTGATSGQKKKKKPDFASVAMSVTVFLALKRMASRKIKERKKKIRHLRKMTFFIISTFLFCWTPYYVGKVTVVVSLHLQQSSISNFPTNATGINITKSNILALARSPSSSLFTWMLAIAALSCSINPILYMFSREKIRSEFGKMFFPACARMGQSEQQRQHRCSASCFVCWETEENFKDRSTANGQGSVINAMQKNRTSNISPAKPKMELIKIPSHGCSREEGTEPPSTRPEVPKVRAQLSTPLLQWNTIDCDAQVDTQAAEEVYERGTKVSQKNHLLLPSIQHDRPRSLSAHSEDIMSCSTTIASLAAEL